MAVAGRRSFVAAARALGRSPQAITRAVAALEARLGARLLAPHHALGLAHRRRRAPPRPRAAASRRAGRARGAARRRRAAVGTADGDGAGAVRSASPGAGGRTISCARIRRSTCASCYVDRVVSLADEGVDLALRIGALPDSALRARLVGHVRSVVCASPRYLADAGVPRAPEALARHACIAFSGTTPHRRALGLRARRRARAQRDGACAARRQHRASCRRRRRRRPRDRARAVVSDLPASSRSGSCGSLSKRSSRRRCRCSSCTFPARPIARRRRSPPSPPSGSVPGFRVDGHARVGPPHQDDEPLAQQERQRQQQEVAG